MKSEGFGLLRAKRKNSRKWLEGYYVRALETAGNNGVPAVRHYIIFQKANGSGRVCRAEINPDTLCRCTGIRDKNLRLIFEHDIVRREIGGEDVIGEVVWSDIGLSGFFLEVTDKGRKSITHSYPISRGEFDDDERNVNTDEIIGNIFDRPKMLKYRR
jgi:uncharacterized phage protein (TIGR01671 family)